MSYLLRVLFLCLPALLLAQHPFTTTIRQITGPANNTNQAFIATSKTLYRSDNQGILLRAVFYTTDDIISTVVGNSGLVVVATTSRTNPIYRSTDNGATFRPVSIALGALPSATTISTSLHIDPFLNNVYFRIASKIFKSTNGGESFSLLTNLASDTALFAISPPNPRVLYQASGDSFSVSSDDGSTWRSQSPPPAPGNFSVRSLTITDIIPHPVTQSIVLIHAQVMVSDSSTPTGTALTTAVYRSPDRGGSWTFVNGGALGFRSSVSRDGSLLVTNGSSCYVSTNFGQTFRTLDNSNTYLADVQGRVWTSNGRLSTDNGNAFAATTRQYFPAIPDRDPVDLTLESGTAWSQYFGLTDSDGAFPPYTLPTATIASDSPWVTFPEGVILVRAGTLPEGTYQTTLTLQNTNWANSPRIPITLRAIAPVTPELTFTTRRLIGNGTATIASGPSLSSGIPDGVSELVLTPNGLLFAAATAIYQRSTTGEISLYAGGPASTNNGTGDGSSAASARFRRIDAMQYAAGNLYILDNSEGRIRRIDSTGIVTTVFNASNIRSFFLSFFSRIAVAPNGDLYLASSGTLYRIDSSGNPVAIPNVSLGTVNAMRSESDSSLLIATSTRLSRLTLNPVQLTILAGSTTSAYSGDNGPATAAQFTNIRQIATDAQRNIYLVDADRLRMISAATSRVLTVAGNGEPAVPTALVRTAVNDGSTAHLSRLPTQYGVIVDSTNRVYLTSGYYLYELTRAAAQGPTPTIATGGVVTGSGRGRIAPASIFSIYGSNFASGQALASTVPLPRTLATVQVLVNGQPVPLYFVSPQQINAQMHSTVQGSATVQVIRNGVLGNTVNVEIVSAQPDIIVYSGTRAVAVNQNGSLNSPTDAAAASEFIVVYLTGIGLTTPAVELGATSPASPLAVPAGPYSATIGSVTTPIAFLGLTPGFIGLAQANIQIPAGLPPGDTNLTITVRGATSNTTQITIR